MLLEDNDVKRQYEGSSVQYERDISYHEEVNKHTFSHLGPNHFTLNQFFVRNS